MQKDLNALFDDYREEYARVSNELAQLHTQLAGLKTVNIAEGFQPLQKFMWPQTDYD